jgi:nicotinate phosphoribosyltransferase
MDHDLLCVYGETLPGRPLLQPVMRQGHRVHPAKEDLQTIRQRVKEELSLLPEKYCQLEQASSPYPVSLSQKLLQEKERIEQGL